MYFLGWVETIGFCKREIRNLILISPIKKLLFKSFFVTPPSTFLVIDINSMYKHTPMIEDKY